MLGGTLLVIAALVVALVVVAAITVFAIVDTTVSVLVAAVVVVVASSHCVGLLRPAFAGEVFELASVALFELVAHLALRVESIVVHLQTAIIRSVLQEQRWNNQGQAVQVYEGERKREKLTYYLELKKTQ